VQTTPAQRAPIAQIVTVDAVVFPLEQATVAPKITSTVKKFFVQRGHAGQKGTVDGRAGKCGPIGICRIQQG